MPQMKVHVRLGNAPSQTSYRALASLKLLRKRHGMESVRVIICTPWSFDMTHLRRTLSYIGEDCFVNPGENRRPVCVTRYPYYPRGANGLFSIGLPERLVRNRFRRVQPRNVDPLTLQIVVEFHCVATVVADALAYAQEVIKSYGMKPIQSISIRCRPTSAWPWRSIVECTEAWTSYIYAPLRCVHNHNVVDIVISDDQLYRKEQHLVTAVWWLQSMFPDTIIRCILKFCV